MAQVAIAASPSPSSASTVAARGSNGGNMGGFQPASSSQATQQQRGDGPLAVLAPAEFEMIPTQVEYLVPTQVQVTLIIDQTIDTIVTSSSPLCRY